VFRPLVVVLVVGGFKWTMVTGGPPVSMRSPSGYVRSSPVGADTVYLNPTLVVPMKPGSPTGCTYSTLRGEGVMASFLQ